MRVRIHRGAHEVGGSCVEVEHDGSRIVLDLGRPLAARNGEHVALPDVPGLEYPDSSLLGVFITHGHADHWGLLDQARADLPVWMGAATDRILRTADFWTRGLDGRVAGHLEHRVPLAVGPFTITPYLNDHSAYDAYSLLVEAGGRGIFYTGDIRGHGRKSGIFEELLRKPPVQVDVLLAEGTNVHPDRTASTAVSETDLEASLVEQFSRTEGLALVVTSAQNIDRLVTIYRAALRAGRDLVMDAYTADIARSTGNRRVPRPSPDWPRVRSYLPRWQAVRIKQGREFHRLGCINPYRVYPEELAAEPRRYVMLFNSSEGGALATAGALEGASCTWSLWSGYLQEASGQRLQSFLLEHGVSLVQQHTSGHASVGDLRRLTEALAPDRIVPIHTDAPAAFRELSTRVQLQPDGAWWAV